MTERFEYSRSGIDMSQMLEIARDPSLSDVMRQFKDTLPGKILTMHFATPSGEDDVVTTLPIEMAAVLSDGTVSLITQDVMQKPSILNIDGHRAPIIWSIYEDDDFWFQDPDNDRIWYGIHDTGLMPMYLVESDDQ